MLEFKGHVVVRDASSCADQATTALRAPFPRAAWAQVSATGSALCAPRLNYE